MILLPNIVLYKFLEHTFDIKIVHKESIFNKLLIPMKRNH